MIGTITFTADLPQEAYDKILGNTPEEMDRMLKPGYAFDLSDGKDRAVTYIAFPEGTKPEDVEKVVKCVECKYKPYIVTDEYDYEEEVFPEYKEGNRCPCQCDDSFYNYIPPNDWYCKNGKRKEKTE